MILGLDISSSSTGYGILDNDGKLVTFGQIRPNAKLDRTAKYVHIANAVRALCDEYRIDRLVLEAYFVGGFRNQSTFVCAEVRGHLKAVVYQEFPEIRVVEEIFPSSLKKVVTGHGKAEKVTVAMCILDKLGIKYSELKGNKSKCTFIVDGNKYYDDASDALSLAYCCYINKL